MVSLRRALPLRIIVGIGIGIGIGIRNRVGMVSVFGSSTFTIDPWGKIGLFGIFGTSFPRGTRGANLGLHCMYMTTDGFGAYPIAAYRLGKYLVWNVVSDTICRWMW